MKNFSIFKNTNKKNDKQPDYRLSTKIGDSYVDIGGAWIKKTADGQTFLSVKLSDAYQDRPGFHIEVEVPPVKVEGKDYDQMNSKKDEINPEEIPF